MQAEYRVDGIGDGMQRIRAMFQALGKDWEEMYAAKMEDAGLDSIHMGATCTRRDLQDAGVRKQMHRKGIINFCRTRMAPPMVTMD